MQPKARAYRGFRIDHAQLEIDDMVRLDAQLIGDGRQKDGVMIGRDVARLAFWWRLKIEF